MLHFYPVSVRFCYGDIYGIRAKASIKWWWSNVTMQYWKCIATDKNNFQKRYVRVTKRDNGRQMLYICFSWNLFVFDKSDRWWWLCVAVIRHDGYCHEMHFVIDNNNNEHVISIIGNWFCTFFQSLRSNQIRNIEFLSIFVQIENCMYTYMQTQRDMT